MLEIKNYKKIREEVLNDLSRRKKVWNVLSGLWIPYDHTTPVYYLGQAIPKDASSADINQIVAKSIASKMIELNLSLSEIKQIYFWEVQLFMNQLHFSIFSPVPIEPSDTNTMEEFFQTKKACLAYPSLCITSYLLIGWINPARSRWKMVKEIMNAK